VYSEISLLFVKTSSDELVLSFVNKLLSDNDRPGLSVTSSNSSRNIGLKVSFTIKGENNEVHRE
jgi:hypothetical protein